MPQDHQRTPVIVVALALVSSLALAGCMGGETVESTFYVKDAPTDDFSEIWIEFSQVEVHAAGDDGGDDGGSDGGADGGSGEQGGQATIAQDGDGDGGEWVTTVDEGRMVNLLSFNSSDAKAFLGDAELETGKYTMIRISVTEAYGIEDGQNKTITVASDTARVNRPFNLDANGTTAQITIDLNLDRSLTKQGDGSWRMTPVVGSVQTNFVDDDPREDQRGPQ